MNDIPHLVYYTEFKDPLPTTLFDNLLDQLGEKVKERIAACRLWQDRHAHVLGRHLLLTAMKRLCFRVNISELNYNQFGRPYFDRAVDFNISHSGSIVVCVISLSGQIGLDIEERRPLNINEFGNQFSTESWHSIMTAPDPEKEFFRYWTIKEAIIKADGRGFSAPCPDIGTLATSHAALDGRFWHLLRINDFEQYECHIASSVPTTKYRLFNINFTHHQAQSQLDFVMG